MASAWKAEKLGLEAKVEKLNQELTFTKTNLERFPILWSFFLQHN